MLTIEEQLKPKFEIRPTMFEEIGGMFDFEILTDNLVAEIPHNGLIVEAGVYRGRFAAYVRELLTYNRPENNIVQHLIDIFQTTRWIDENGVPQVFGEYTELFFPVARFRDMKPGGREILADVKFIQLPSHKALRAYEPNEIDFLYVDADHSAWGCYGDITLGAPNVKPGGVVLIHDYHHVHCPNVTSAVDLFMNDNPHVEFNFHRCKSSELTGLPQNHLVWFRAPENPNFKIREKADFEKAIKKFPVFSPKTKPLIFE